MTDADIPEQSATPEGEELSLPIGDSGPGRARRKRWVWLSGAAVGVAFLAWVGLMAVHIVASAREVRLGMAEIEAAKASLTKNGTISAAVLQEIHGASEHFGKASADLSGPSLDVATWVPLLGAQISSLRDLSSGAREASQIGDRALREVQHALADHPPPGSTFVGTLQSVSAISQQALTDLGDVRLGSTGPLLPPLQRGRAKLAKDLRLVEAALSRAQLTARTVSGLLQGSHHYLVLAANNAEMRAGSGMFLEAGVLTTGRGHLQLGPMVPTSDLALAAGAVQPRGDLEARWGWLEPGAEWRNLAFSPRFDATGNLASQMWFRRTGQTVDGVIAVDTQAIDALLAGTGPIDVAGTRVGAVDATEFLMLDQYLGALGDPYRRGRVDSLGTLAHQISARLTKSDFAAAPLAVGMSQAVAGRHLLVWSADPQTEADWAQIGAAGLLTSRSLEVAVENEGGNKLDQFLSVSANLGHRPVRGGTALTLQIHVADHTPPGLPTYVAGPTPGAGTAPGEYAGLLAVSLPGGAYGAEAVGYRQLPVAGRDGPSLVLAVPLRVRAGQAVDVTVVFQLAGRHATLTVEPSARIPATSWHVGAATFGDWTAHTVSW